MRYLVVLFALFAVACNSGDSKQEAKPEKPKVDFTQMWTWPTASGTPRDLRKDNEVCREQAKNVTPNLVRLHKYGECMKGKGWELAKRESGDTRASP